MNDRRLTNKEVDLSLELGRMIGARLKQCYHNAWGLFQRDHLWIERLNRGRDPGVVYYVEGFFDSFGFPVEHAWVEIGEGDEMIRIDPTLFALRRIETSEDPIYFPAYRYDLNRAAAKVVSSGRVPIWVDLEGTPDFLPMMQARERAWANIKPEIAALMREVREGAAARFSRKYGELMTNYVA